MTGDRFTAAGDGVLFALLVQQFPGFHRNTLRERLRRGCVLVNGVAAARADQLLRAGDRVELLPLAAAPLRPPAGRALRILFDDADLLAIDKPAGLLSVASDDERERTALALARRQCARADAPDLWPVHRLDRETSGVLLFARSRAVLEAVRADWGAVRKVYHAIVEGRPEPPQGTIDRPLWEDRTLRVHVGHHPDARPARTRYATLASRGGRSLLEIELDTGRKHQIRAHLAAIGCPVVGDARYGTRAARLCLHALHLSLPHPRDGRRLELVAEAPAAFRREFAAS
ncbi:MAG: RluA family pseudouridine synthase [Planctomycetes bacterium]|nr:RluA family pseudouridine synthase [Planctomycetota bacterium]